MALIDVSKYAELRSRMIVGLATPAQQKQMTDFELAQPERCPHCGTSVRGFIIKTEIVHDVPNCPAKAKPKE
jgi:hypothetical protein